jgi:hypothetical protein
VAVELYKEGNSFAETIGDDLIFTQSVIGGVKNGFSIEVDRVMQNYKIVPYINGVVAGGTLYWKNDQIVFIQEDGFSLIVDTKNPNYLCLLGLSKGGEFTERNIYVSRDGSVHYLRTDEFGQFGSLEEKTLPKFFDMSKIKFDIVAHRYKWKGEFTSYRQYSDTFTMCYYAYILNEARKSEGIEISKIFGYKVSYISNKLKLNEDVEVDINEDYNGCDFKVKKDGKCIFSISIKDIHCEIRGGNGEILLVYADESLKIAVASKKGKIISPIYREFPFTDELLEEVMKKEEEADEEELVEDIVKEKTPLEKFNDEYKSLERHLKDLYKNFRFDAKISKFNPSKKDNMPKIESVTVFKCIDIDGSTLTIPHPTTSIKKETFSNLAKKSQVLKLTLCENLQSIEEGTFSNFTALEKIEFNSPKVDKIRKNTFANTNLSRIYFPSGIKVIEKGACYGSNNLLEIYVPSGCKVMDGAVPEHTAIFYYGNLTKEEVKKNKTAKNLAKKFAKMKKGATEKPKVKLAQKTKKVKKGYSNPFGLLGNFFKKVGVFLLNVLLFIPRKTWALLKIIGDFFRYDFADKIGGFFSILLKVLLFIPYCIAWPFIKLYTSFRRGFHGGAIISLLTIVIGAFVLVAGHFGWLKVTSDAVTNFFEYIRPDSWFGMHLCSGIAELIDRVSDEYALLVLPLGILFIPSLVLDLVWNLIVVILVILNAIVYFIVGISLFYGAGVWICLPAGITVIMASGRHGKVIPIICLLIGIACTVLYYISFNSFYY